MQIAYRWNCGLLSVSETNLTWQKSRMPSLPRPCYSYRSDCYTSAMTTSFEYVARSVSFIRTYMRSYATVRSFIKPLLLHPTRKWILFRLFIGIFCKLIFTTRAKSNFSCCGKGGTCVANWRQLQEQWHNWSFSFLQRVDNKGCRVLCLGYPSHCVLNTIH